MNYYCSKCKVSIEKKVYDYSKKEFGKDLCRDCQQEIPKEKKVQKRNNSFIESVIKGRIAETIIEELFLTLNWRVFRYGMENTIPGVMELLKGINSKVSQNIKRMPDFVVQNPETNEVFFIEVKFRKSGNFDINDKSLKNYPYTNAYFILVSKKHIKCISYKELQEGKEIMEGDRKYLGDREEFKLNKGKIKEFCEFAVRFFQGV